MGFACSFFSFCAAEEVSHPVKRNIVMEHIAAVMGVEPGGQCFIHFSKMWKAHDFGVPGNLLVLAGKCRAIRKMAVDAIKEQLGGRCPKEGSPEFEAMLASSLAQMVNPARTKIWNPDGTVNEKIFAEFCALATPDSEGRKVISKSNFDKLLGVKQQEARDSGEPVDGTAAKVFFQSISWARVTEGSVGELWQSAPSKLEGGEYITLDDFILFYTEPFEYMRRVRASRVKKITE